MTEYCKVCGVQLKTSNRVDYRPGSCRDCELERKKLYSSLSLDSGSSKSLKKLKKVTKKVKATKPKGNKKKKSAKSPTSGKDKLKKQKELKLKKLAKMKKLAKIRELREQRRKKLRIKVEKLRKQRALRALKLKLQKKKQKQKEKKEKELLKARIRKAKEIERKLLQKEREKLKHEKEKLRQITRAEKERLRNEKRNEKEKIRAEKLRIKQEKQTDKERLKKAKEAAKQAIVQAKEAARQAAQEQRKQREDARKQPIVSIVTKLKELQLPPDVKLVEVSKDQFQKSPQPTKIMDPKKPSLANPSASILESAKVIPANAKYEEEKDILKQSLTAQHNETIQKEVEKLQKDSDPIIDRYNPYSTLASNKDIPRPPSPTPWLAPNFTVVKGDFKETNQNEDGSTITSGLTDDQVKDIIEKIKGEHKKKTP